MKSVAERYAYEMRKKYGEHFVAWPLDNNLTLGDYGTLRNGIFTRLGNVKHFGLNFKVLKGTPDGERHHCSKGVSSTKITANGKAVTEAVDIATGFEVEFSTENLVLFEAINVQRDQIDNVNKLGAQLISIYNTGKQGQEGEKWDKNFVVITEIDIAGGVTVLISTDKKSNITIQASADTGKLHLNIADPKLGLTHIRSTGVNDRLIAKCGSKPLFRLMGIQKNTFRPQKMIRPRPGSKPVVDLTFGYVENTDWTEDL